MSQTPAFVFESLPLSPLPPYADQPEAEFEFPEAQPRETQDMQVDEGIAAPTKDASAGSDAAPEPEPVAEEEGPQPIEVDETHPAPVEQVPQRASPMQLRSLVADGQVLEAASTIVSLAVARCTPKRPSSDVSDEDTVDDEEEEDAQSDAVADEYDDTKHRYDSPTRLYMSQAHNELVRQLNAMLTDIKGNREPVDESMRFKTHYNLFSSITRRICESMNYACVPDQDKTQFNTYVSELWNDMSAEDKDQWKAELPYHRTPRSSAGKPKAQPKPKAKAPKVKRAKPNPVSDAASSSSSVSSSPSKALAAMQVSVPVAVAVAPVAPAMARALEPCLRLTPQLSSVLSAVELDIDQSSGLGHDGVMDMLEDCDNPLDLLPRLSQDQRRVIAAISRALRPHRSREDVAMDASKLFAFSTSKREQL